MGTLKVILISSLVTLVTLSSGCNQVQDISAGVDVSHATEVTFAQRKEATKGETKFRWVGSDDNFHYFETQKGFYRLTTKFEMPHFKHLMDRKWEPGILRTDVRIVGEKIAVWNGQGRP